MLPPLDALGVAAATVQFIDFACMFISSVNQFRKGNTPVEIGFVRDQTSTLIGLNAGLRLRRKRIAESDGQIAEHERQLDDILSKCCKIANELTRSLAKLSNKDGGFKSALHQSFLYFFKKDEMDDMFTRLQQYRDAIASYTLMMLNEKFEYLGENLITRLDRMELNQEILKQGNEQILEAMTFSKQVTIAHNIRGVGMFTQAERDLLESQRSSLEVAEDTTQAVKILDEHPVSAVLVLSDQGDNVRYVYLNPAEDSSSAAVSGRGYYVDHATTIQQAPMNPKQEKVVVTDFRPMLQCVLRALRFTSLRDREDNIHPAHRATFEWIFQESSINDAPHSNFVDFLEGSERTYWVNGKAGSGKSTLMKFIHQHKSTRLALSKWSQSSGPVFASHFFWNAGTALQKSMAGLLRSILLAILAEHHQAVAVAFPQFCHQFLAYDMRDTPSFTSTDLSEALNRLLSFKGRVFNLFLLLDGADEFAGDHFELCQFLHHLSSFESVKIVVSSRPLSVYVHTFESCPKLRLQDLTRKDIEAYTREQFASDRAFKQFEESYPTTASSIVNDITERASGVFLWVCLVVRSLRTGLLNYDTPSDLRMRLEAMPTDLEEFYKKMLQDMAPEYREEAVRMFLIVLQRIKDGARPLGLLQMHYALSESLDQSVKASNGLLTAQERRMLSEMMERRLASRTSGLIEIVRQSKGDFSGSSTTDLYVDFLHRTVVDFLDIQEVNQDLLSTAKFFDPNVALIAGTLQEIKVLPTEHAVIIESDRAMNNMFDCLHLEKALEVRWKRPYSAVLDELNGIMTTHWTAANLCKRAAHQDDWDQIYRNDATNTSKNASWSAYVLDIGNSKKHMSPIRRACEERQIDPYLGLAMLHGCYLYVADKTLATETSVQLRSTLLAEVVYRYFFGAWSIEDEETSARIPTDQRFNMITAVNRFLAQGARPDETQVFPIPYRLLEHFKNPTEAPDGSEQAEDVYLRLSSWECCLLSIFDICIDRGPDSQRTQTFKSTEQACQLFRLFTEFLSHGAVLSCDSPGLRSVRDSFPALQDMQLPLTAESVLNQLQVASLHPFKRIFTNQTDEASLERVKAAYQEALTALEQRKLVGVLVMKVRHARKLFKEFLKSSAFQSIYTFVLGGLIVLIIARLWN